MSRGLKPCNLYDDYDDDDDDDGDDDGDDDDDDDDHHHHHQLKTFVPYRNTIKHFLIIPTERMNHQDKTY
jgi:hypothetical protein